MATPGHCRAGRGKPTMGLMDRAAVPRLAAARADAQRLRKRALLARIDTLRIFAELDSTLLHIGTSRYLAQVAPLVQRLDAPLR